MNATNELPQPGSPIKLTLITSGPGINAYTLQAEIVKTGIVRTTINSVALSIDVTSQRLQDSNELYIEGTIIGAETVQ